jgi:hypothetical protein
MRLRTLKGESISQIYFGVSVGSPPVEARSGALAGRPIASLRHAAIPATAAMTAGLIMAILPVLPGWRGRFGHGGRTCAKSV